MESSKQLWPGLQSFIFSRVKFVSFLMCYSPGFFSFLGKKTIITAIMTLWKRMKRIFVSTYLHLRERYGNNNNDNKCSYLFAFFSVITILFHFIPKYFCQCKTFGHLLLCTCLIKEIQFTTSIILENWSSWPKPTFFKRWKCKQALKSMRRSKSMQFTISIKNLCPIFANDGF